MLLTECEHTMGPTPGTFGGRNSGQWSPKGGVNREDKNGPSTVPGMTTVIPDLINQDETLPPQITPDGVAPQLTDLQALQDWEFDSGLEDSYTTITSNTIINNDLDDDDEGDDGDKTLSEGSTDISTDVEPSSSLEELSEHYPIGGHSIEKAVVSGFVPLKQNLSGVGSDDMAFVVDVTWSDGRTHMVKRTYADFYNFHFYLLEEWGAQGVKDGLYKLTYYLPDRDTRDDEGTIEIAENRELQLNKYVRELVKLPHRISASPTVLTFFESRGSDPKPYRETVRSSSSSVADQYMLCWI